MKKKLFEIYKNLKMGSNEICRNCRNLTQIENNALSAWIIQNKQSETNILFVGKVARGDQIGELINEKLEDATVMGDELIHESSWAYWSYTREIIKTVYGDLDSGLKNVSFTNIVKCNNNTDEDTTSYIAKQHCISQNKFIWKEIEILRPKKVIFYTNYYYDDFIDEYTPTFASKISEIKDRNCEIKIGKKTMPWWERNYFSKNDQLVLSTLRIGHPERKKKIEFIKMVSDWIKL